MASSLRFAMAAIGAAVMVGLSSPTTMGQKPDVVTISRAELGFGGVAKAGYWTPVRVTLAADENLQGRLVLTTEDGDGVPVRFEDAESDLIELTAGEPRTVLRYVKLGRWNRRTGRLRGDLKVEFVNRGEVLGARTWFPGELPLALASSHEWVLTLGPEMGVKEVLPRSQVTVVSEPEALPDRWFGYEAVNTIMLATSDAASLANWRPEQVEALIRWVNLGGRLILSVGSQGEALLTGDSPWQALAPGQFARIQPVRSLPALETYTFSSRAIDTVSVDGARAEIPLSLLQNVRGKVSVVEPAADGPRPIVIRAPVGFGQVVFVAVDLDRPPLRQWEGRARLIENLVHGDSLRQERTLQREGTEQLVHLGYDDIVGQLRVALDQFSGARLVPFSWVAGLIALYLVLLGPIDYLLLKDVLHRQQWTWWTFPSLAVIFGGLGVALHQQFILPAVKINQLDVVDVDTEQALVRGTTWFHLYSPRTEGYDLHLQSGWVGEPGADRALLSWQGLPGPGLGGLEGGAAALFTTPYTLQWDGDGTRLLSVPVQTNGTRSFGARWATSAEFSSPTKLSVDADGLLRGEIANPLPVELTDCQLLYQNWVYRLDRTGGILRPGQATRIEMEQALNLNWRLTRRRVVEIRDVTTPWDQRDLDVPRIVEIMMFQAAAGGEGYTHLNNRYQAYLDLSEHLRTGRAILVGRTREPASEVVLNRGPAQTPYDQRWTFCRVVFPVARTSLLD